jgi:serine protease Do
MTKRGWAVVFVAGLAVGGLAVWSAQRARTAFEPRAAAAADLPSSRRNAIVIAAQRVSPAVVSVSVLATRTVRADPFGGVMRDEFFDRFFPPMEYQEQVSGLGSGVIVDPSGLVLTNEHVVRNADDVKVTLADGRQLPAKVLGGTSVYDLAVIKVEGAHLPAAPLGDSDDLVVGEWAIAIGSPFGYLLNDTQPTVTAGVVSATRRDIKSEVTEMGMYKNMIQTDAAINPGNSGGPLVNADGEVIGINTFIFTQGGGSIGLGFAIPINLGKKILQEIKTFGRVRVAWPGMTLQPVTPYVAQRLGFKDLSGMVVSRVEPGGPAAGAGIQVGDRIRKVNGKPVNSVDDAQAGIYGAAVGDRLKITVEREGRAQDFTLTLAEAPGRRE